MYVACVTVWVKPGTEKKFIEATRLNHLGTRKEPGNLRFDVSQKEDDPTQFLLYEVYRAKEDLAAHHASPHYLEWRTTVEPLMAKPRQGVRHWSLYPADDGF
jgi:autoinducer 2-degrading protein